MKKQFIATFLLAMLVFASQVFALTATPPAIGDGSWANPYQISSMENLYWLSVYGDKHKCYLQTVDIDASPANPLPGGFPSIRNFAGSYNGGGHTITGLQITTLAANLGLFAETDNAYISNLGLENVFVEGSFNVGALVGKAYQTTISKCYVTGSVFGNKADPMPNPPRETYIGGMCGYSINSNFSECYTRVLVQANFPQISICSGLVGCAVSGSARNSFWDKENIYKPDPTNTMGTGVTAAQLKNQSTYTEWNFTDIWFIDPLINYGTPALRNKALKITAQRCSTYVEQTKLNSFQFTYSGTDTIGAGAACTGGLTVDYDPNTVGNYQITRGTLTVNGPFYMDSYTPEYLVVREYFSGGRGTSENPYRISTLNDLKLLSETPGFWNKCFRQTANIDASATKEWNNLSGWSPIGSESVPFTGTYSGDGKNISELTINRPTENSIGLFGVVGKADISSVLLSNAHIKGQNGTGGVIGTSKNSGLTLRMCAASGTVSGKDYVGGLIGVLGVWQSPTHNDSVQDCLSSCAVSGSSQVGGLIGALCSDVRRSYSRSTVSASAGTSGGMEGGRGDAGGTVISSFWDNMVCTAGSKFGIGKPTSAMKNHSTFSDWDFTATWAIDTLNKVSPFYAGYPYLRSLWGKPLSVSAVSCTSYVGEAKVASFRYTYFGADTIGAGASFVGALSIDNYPTSEAICSINKGTLAAADPFAISTFTPGTLSVLKHFSGGSGTPEHPFQISTLNDLQFLCENPTYWNRSFVQTADINAESTASWYSGLGFKPIGDWTTPFTGTYDGGGKVVANIFIYRETDGNVGFFGYVAGASIRNLGIVSALIAGAGNVGGVIGCEDLEYRFSNGRHSQISNCFSTGAVVATSRTSAVGGFIGNFRGKSEIRDCYSTCSVRAPGTAAYAGGFQGTGNQLGEEVISRCYSAGDVTGAPTEASGFACRTQLTSSIYNDCYWDCDAAKKSDYSEIPWAGYYLSTASMKTQGCYRNWDFKGESANGTSDIWDIDPVLNNGYPFLSWQKFPTKVTAWPTASPIVYGTTLGSATLAVIETPLPGTFTFVDPTQKPKVSESGLFDVVFTPTDSRYLPVTGKVAVTVTPKTVTVVSITADNKIYDGTDIASISACSLNPEEIVGTDVVRVDMKIGAKFTGGKNVGKDKEVQVPTLYLTGADASNYQLNPTYPTTTASITPKIIPISECIADSREYDGTDTVHISNYSCDTDYFVYTDNARLNGTPKGNLESKTIGDNKKVTVSGLTITGTDADNYAVAPIQTTASITPRTVTLLVTALDKVYDKTPYITVRIDSIIGKIAGDDLTATAGGTIIVSTSGGTVGSYDVSTPDYFPNGSDSKNYLLRSPVKGLNKVTITPKPLTIVGATIKSKTYDGTTAAEFETAGMVDGVIAGDDVQMSPIITAAFTDKNAGNTKKVTAWCPNMPDAPSLPLITGTSCSNYSISDTLELTGTISPKTVTITGLKLADKVYDGTDVATLTGGTIGTGVINGDVVSLSDVKTTFIDKNVGTKKLSQLAEESLFSGSCKMFKGKDSANYQYDPIALISTSNLTGSITAKQLLITVDKNSKTYGAADPTLSASISGFVNGETESVLTKSPIVSREPGEDAKSYVITASGAEAANYTFSYTAGTFTIESPADPVITATVPAGMVYGSTLAESALSANIPGAFSSVPVFGTVLGAGENSVTVTFTPTDKNYKAVSKNVTVTVAKAPLTVTASAASKVAGTADPVLTYAITGFVNGESDGAVTVKPAITRSAGDTVGVYDITLSGGESANYTLNYVGAKFTIQAETEISDEGFAKANGLKLGIYVLDNPVTADKAELIVSTDGSSEIRVVILDPLGNLLDEQTSVAVTSGEPHQFSWNLCDRSGNPVGTGSYLAAARVKDLTTGSVKEFRTVIGVKR